MKFVKHLSKSESSGVPLYLQLAKEIKNGGVPKNSFTYYYLITNLRISPSKP